MHFILGTALIQQEPQNVYLQAYQRDSFHDYFGEKSIPGTETQKLAQKTKVWTKETNTVLLPKILLFQYFQIGLD